MVMTGQNGPGARPTSPMASIDHSQKCHLWTSYLMSKSRAEEGPTPCFVAKCHWVKKNHIITPMHHRTALYMIFPISITHSISTTTGQSGNFLSPFYSNMAQKWADVDYLKMSTKPGDYEKDAVGVWVMRGAE